MKPEYLGDGVYISFDGYQWWLAANHHENRVIALEPGMIERIVAYQQRTIAHHNKAKVDETPT